jgi:exodeoxyribonuclease-3
MRIATWNVNSLKARLDKVVWWLERARPDVLLLQETKLADTDLDVARAALTGAGYELAHRGEGRWNGVAIASRCGIEDVIQNFDPAFTEARFLSAVCGGVRVATLYAPNGRSVASEHYVEKLAWFEGLARWLATSRSPDEALVLGGDFNVAPADDDVWDPAAFSESTHVTPPERAALAALRDTGLRDVVPRALKYDRPFTYWDYRAGMFHKNLGMRIDLVYGNAGFAGAVRDAYVDREARKGKGASDHAPVVVDLDL